MRLSLEALQVLDAIDRKGSFAGAAEELHRVPSAITYTVQQLEEGLDVRLYDRDGRRARLTPAGYELLSEGRQLLRAAADLECRIQQVARGWETELRIAVDTIIGAQRLYPLIEAFYRLESGTRIKVSTEVLGGNWDALMSARADLVIGAAGDPPAGGGLASLPLMRIAFAFAVAPTHPICREPLPLSEATILKYRAVSIADSSRNLPPRTVGLLSGQDTLTVPTMEDKIAAQIAGLGVGYLPQSIAYREAAAGRLTVLPVEAGKYGGEMIAVWRPNRTGKALRWFVQQLEQASVLARLVEGIAGDAPALPAQAMAAKGKSKRK